MIALLLAACGGQTGTPDVTPSPSLEGSEWVLVSLAGRDPLPGTSVTLKFEDGRAAGVAGCNSYGGPYTANANGTLALGEMAMTVMLCNGPVGIMEQEQAFADLLLHSTTYRLDGDRLEITQPTSGKTLTFARKAEFAMDPKALPGTRWRLVSFGGQMPTTGSNAEPITLLFGSAGEAGGFAGCRHFRTWYEAEGDNITFYRLDMVEADCPNPGALTTEGQYTDALSSATDYRLVEGRLELLTARSEVLVFEALER